jgi:predicted RNA-binding Zn-ribbon protein involved in translation (DUF1610 family)
VKTRTCNQCGGKASPWIPRTRVGEELLCAGCAKSSKTAELERPADRHPYGTVLDHLRDHHFSPSHELYSQLDQMDDDGLGQLHDFEHTASFPIGGTPNHDHEGDTMAEHHLAYEGSLNKQAHDSGDGATVFHCPMCGSGQVIARSDRTIECEYCHTCFTVQVQPQFPSFPQTINGAPVQVPGMPGQIGGPPAAPGQDPMQGGFPPDEEGAEDAPFGDEEEEDPQEQEGLPQDDEEDSAPPFAKGSMLRTASGAGLSYETYLKHLAIKHADDRDAVIERVRMEGSD